MPIKAINTSEPILGYTLKERIGSGGYGEVWVAEAPGGLAKAIKFIYGYHDENRAQRELRSLNRIKEVRHPFLLSLERIDIVDGQMVVITELADMSLKDRFDQCIESGLKGIPRAELLGYLRDAADALDYISQEHRLQHLDVKPENLLLVSGHVKVADYGLVKDIHDGTQSLMGGLTPAFAPPELFDGRPSKASDQYSLAIVYQEMLTGKRPFDGVTAAQLASQHMKERPHLSSLPRDDQAVVSRALAKDPDLRFPSCRVMVDELGDHVTSSAKKPRKSTPKQKSRTRITQTPDATLHLPEGTHPLAMRPAEITKLPPVDCDPKQAKARPTLFLGIGHTGTHILRQLRRRLRHRIGDTETTPSIALLCLDTDRRDLAAACRGDAADVLHDSEVFPLPLRRSEDYRVDAKMHLAWLSRRWIYNVPRSLQTEGIRPLGRLAFADHHAQLFVRLRQVLSDVTRQESLADTAETLRMDPHEQPRVYIVGSISGGACSGMAIDVAYAIRTILQELGVPDDDIVGLFTHSARRCVTDRELAVANALAFLSELYHFSCVDNYPGDETCGLPAFDDDSPTFGSTYLVHLGDELVQKDFDAVSDSIAEYLFLSSATRCATFFDTCRFEEPETSGLALRTLGVSRSGGVSDDILMKSTDMLCRHLLQTWLGKNDEGTDFDAKEFARNHLRSLRLSTEELVQQIHEVVLARHAEPVPELAQRMQSGFDPANRRQSLDRAREAADQFVQGNSHGDESVGIQLDIDQVRRQFLESVAGRLTAGILALVDEPHARFDGAQRGQREIADELQAQLAKVESLQAVTTDRLQSCEARLTGETPLEDPTVFFREFAQLRLQLFTLNAVVRLFHALKSVVAANQQELDLIDGHLNSIAELYVREGASREGTLAGQEAEIDPAVADFATCILAQLQQRLPRLVSRVDQYLQHGTLEAHGGLRRILGGDQTLSHLVRPLEEAARATVMEELKETNLDDFLGNDQDGDVKGLVQWLNMMAQPRLLRCGGTTRMLLGIPERSRSTVIPEEFHRQLDQIPCVIASTAGELVACYEVEQIPLNNVTLTLLQNRPEAIEFASRLHTRTDIAWSPLTAIR